MKQGGRHGDRRASSAGARIASIVPGVAFVAALALVSAFAASAASAPLYLCALALGFAARPLVPIACLKGIDFAAKPVLRIGVALLGVRIGVEQLMLVGFETVGVLVVAIVSTICVGALAARALRLPAERGVLTGAAVAICGASAALAVSAVLPRRTDSEAQTMFTIVGVTLASTVCMVAYPILAESSGFSARETGIFLGGTIHDVAQVVGAGYSVSQEVGDLATLTKLSRVAMLLPVCIVLLALVRWGLLARNEPSGTGPTGGAPLPRFPSFLVAFAVLAVCNSLGAFDAAQAAALVHLSSAFLLAAVVALGLKTSIEGLRAVGWRMSFLVVVQTLWIAGFVGGWLALF